MGRYVGKWGDLYRKETGEIVSTVHFLHTSPHFPPYLPSPCFCKMMSFRSAKGDCCSVFSLLGSLLVVGHLLLDMVGVVDWVNCGFCSVAGSMAF